MKKFFVYGLCLTLCLSGIGCSSSDVEETNKLSTKEVQALTELKSDLYAVNAEYAKTNTRGLKKWLRWLIFGAADAAGFVTGGGALAVSASTLAWTVTKEEKGVTQDSTFKNCAEVDIDEESIGYAHNKLSQKIVKAYEESLPSMSINQLAEIVEKESKVYPAIENKSVDRGTLKQIISAFNADASIQENLNAFKQFTDDSQKQEALDICGIVLEGLQNVSDENTTYIDQVNRLVDAASIRPQTKKMIKGGISVANASAKLWNSSELEDHPEEKR